MNSQIIIIAIVVLYLFTTTLFGFYQSKHVRTSKEYTLTRLSPFIAATYLTGFTLGGVATYGVAGDTIKFGFTYLIWFPISMALGWWVTGILFAGPYFRKKGVTLPTLIGSLFSERTRLTSLASLLIYTIFVIIIEIYTLSMIIKSIFPAMDIGSAVIISLVACVGTVAFSGILGASLTNLIHSLTMVIAFGLVFFILKNAVGGWSGALDNITDLYGSISAKQNIPIASWLSPLGLGWGVIGQIILAKTSRLGGINTVSNLAASCRNQKEAKISFWIAGFISAIPPFLACSIGIFTAAYLGKALNEMPIYTAIGFAVSKFNPYIAGLFLAAILAAVISTFSPLALSFSSIFVEDIFIRIFPNTSDKTQKFLHPASIIVISSLCAWYIVTHGIEHIMPFVFSTAFPCTIPNTMVILFGLRAQKTSDIAAFLSILLGVSISLIWGLILGDPFGIPNIYIAFFIPLIILSFDQLIIMLRSRFPRPYKTITRSQAD